MSDIIDLSADVNLFIGGKKNRTNILKCLKLTSNYGNGWSFGEDFSIRDSPCDHKFKYKRIKIFGAIPGDQQMEELAADIKKIEFYVNCLGYCVAYTGDKDDATRLGDGGAIYRLSDRFDWSKYVVISVPANVHMDWRSFELGGYLNCGDRSGRVLSTDEESVAFKLNAASLFIGSENNWVLDMWEVNAPGGNISEVRYRAKVHAGDSGAKIEVCGKLIYGQNLKQLASELRGRALLVNSEGHCLFYNGDPASKQKRGRGGMCHKVLDRFNWAKYFVTWVWESGSYVDFGEILIKIREDCTLLGKSDESQADRERQLGGKEKEKQHCAEKQLENKIQEFDSVLKVLEKKIASYRQLLEDKDTELKELELKKKEGESSLRRLQLEEKELEMSRKKKELEGFRSKLEKEENELAVRKSHLKELYEKQKELEDSKSELKDRLLSDCTSQLNELKRELCLCKKHVDEKHKEKENQTVANTRAGTDVG